MEGMNNIGMRAPRVPKDKIYTVDVRKARAPAELSVFSPTNGFEEIVSSKPSRKAPIFRYFRFTPNPKVGIPKAQLEAAFAAAVAAAVPPPAPPQPAAAPQLPPAPANSQGSYGAMHEDEGVNDLANFLEEQGVASQGEFDELAALMEQKAQIGGARRRSRRQKTRGRKSRHHSRRYRK
jgi:hypothetical protein